MLSQIPLLVALSLSSLSSAHMVITYPGQRGNMLNTNGTDENGHPPPGSSVINCTPDGKRTFPYGQEWTYPCGGMPTTSNRTKWPISGGALALQPGWFVGHAFALFYINLGVGTEPLNMSLPMIPVFQLVGPSNEKYPNSQFCFPQVPLPLGYKPQVGDNATIQIIETAQHGAALYACADITFADDHDPEIPEVTRQNCFNSTKPGEEVKFNFVITTQSLNAAAALVHPIAQSLVLLGLLAALLW